MKSKARNGLSFGMVDQRDLTDPQTILAIAITLGYTPELDGKSLLLKTLHTGV